MRIRRRPAPLGQVVAGIIALLMATATEGCTYAPTPDEHYPSGWPQAFLGAAPDCQRLFGSYANEGKTSRKDRSGHGIRLSDLLFSDDKKALAILGDAKALELHVEKGYFFSTLHVAAGEHRFEASGCACYDDTLIVPVAHTAGTVPGLALSGTGTTAFFTKASDGSLIVKIKSETSGIVVVVPIYYSHTPVWARFVPIGS